MTTTDPTPKSRTPGNSRSSRPRVSGIILAAGLSRRMGRPKQLLQLGDQTLLQRAIGHALESKLDEVLVVLGHRADEISDSLSSMNSKDFKEVVAADYRGGISHSLRAGLADASPESEAAAILLGDQPGIDSALIDRLMMAWADGRPAILRPLYCPAGADPVPGHPVLLARSVWSTIDTLTGDDGARELIRDHPAWLETVPIEGRPPIDIDTPEDHAQTRRTR